MSGESASPKSGAFAPKRNMIIRYDLNASILTSLAVDGTIPNPQSDASLTAVFEAWAAFGHLPAYSVAVADVLRALPDSAVVGPDAVIRFIVFRRRKPSDARKAPGDGPVPHALLGVPAAEWSPLFRSLDLTKKWRVEVVRVRGHFVLIVSDRLHFAAGIATPCPTAAVKAPSPDSSTGFDLHVPVFEFEWPRGAGPRSRERRERTRSASFDIDD